MPLKDKDHIPFITAENENILFAYIAGFLKKKSCHSYIVGGVSNHIHIITHLHPTVALASLVKDIKMASHKMILENEKLFSHFPGWQVGYSGFTYHISAKENLILDLIQPLRGCNNCYISYHGCYRGYWNLMPPALMLPWLLVATSAVWHLSKISQRANF